MSSFTKKDEQYIREQVEQEFGIQLSTWYFKPECQSKRICIWITNGGNIALRHQAGGVQSKKRPNCPTYWVLNEPRYYTTIKGLKSRIRDYVIPALEGYRTNGE